MLYILCAFTYIRDMKSMVIKPKSQTEFKFINDLLKRLGIGFSIMTEEEIEDFGLSKMLLSAEKNKKTSNRTIHKKLNS